MANRKHESPTDVHGSGKGSRVGAPPHLTAPITKEQREHMIAEAAYYIAEHRHFRGGDAFDDWMQGQMEVDQRLQSASRLANLDQGKGQH